MMVVSFEEEMREAFAAGQASVLAMTAKSKLKWPDAADAFANVPKTYEEWIASIADRPATVRG